MNPGNIPTAEEHLRLLGAALIVGSCLVLAVIIHTSAPAAAPDVPPAPRQVVRWLVPVMDAHTAERLAAARAEWRQHTMRTAVQRLASAPESRRREPAARVRPSRAPGTEVEPAPGRLPSRTVVGAIALPPVAMPDPPTTAALAPAATYEDESTPGEHAVSSAVRTAGRQIGAGFQTVGRVLGRVF